MTVPKAVVEMSPPESTPIPKISSWEKRSPTAREPVANKTWMVKTR